MYVLYIVNNAFTCLFLHKEVTQIFWWGRSSKVSGNYIVKNRCGQDFSLHTFLKNFLESHDLNIHNFKWAIYNQHETKV